MVHHFETRANRAKHLYERLKYAGILFAVCVTVLSGIGAVDRWVLAVVGGLAAVCAAFLAASNAQQLWVRSRGIQQELQKERFLYATGAGPYEGLSEEEGVRRFSERLMSTWSAGHERWQQVVQEVQEPTSADQTGR